MLTRRERMGAALAVSGLGVRSPCGAALAVSPPNSGREDVPVSNTGKARMRPMPAPTATATQTRRGLSQTEAARRLEARGKLPRQRSSRSYASIVRANTLTIPNGILLVFGVLTVVFDSWRDALSWASSSRTS